MGEGVRVNLFLKSGGNVFKEFLQSIGTQGFNS